MTTTMTAPEGVLAARVIAEPSDPEREAREVAEAARESEWTRPSFLRELFHGELRLDLIHPYPAEDPREEERARPFMERLEAVLRRWRPMFSQATSTLRLTLKARVQGPVVAIGRTPGGV